MCSALDCHWLHYTGRHVRAELNPVCFDYVTFIGIIMIHMQKQQRHSCCRLTATCSCVMPRPMHMGDGERGSQWKNGSLGFGGLDESFNVLSRAGLLNRFDIGTLVRTHAKPNATLFHQVSTNSNARVASNGNYLCIKCVRMRIKWHLLLCIRMHEQYCY